MLRTSVSDHIDSKVEPWKIMILFGKTWKTSICVIFGIYGNMVKKFYFDTMIMSTFKASPNASGMAFSFLSPSLWFEFYLLFLVLFLLVASEVSLCSNIFPHSVHFSLAWQVLCLSSLGWFGKLLGFLEHFTEMQIYFPVWLCINKIVLAFRFVVTVLTIEQTGILWLGVVHRLMLSQEEAKSHWLHLFGFSPLCVFKCLLKPPVREEA